LQIHLESEALIVRSESVNSLPSYQHRNFVVEHTIQVRAPLFSGMRGRLSVSRDWQRLLFDNSYSSMAASSLSLEGTPFNSPMVGALAFYRRPLLLQEAAILRG
jgi:hypothetical protein